MQAIRTLPLSEGRAKIQATIENGCEVASEAIVGKVQRLKDRKVKRSGMRNAPEIALYFRSDNVAKRSERNGSERCRARSNCTDARAVRANEKRRNSYRAICPTARQNHARIITAVRRVARRLIFDTPITRQNQNILFSFTKQLTQ